MIMSFTEGRALSDSSLRVTHWFVAQGYLGFASYIMAPYFLVRDGLLPPSPPSLTQINAEEVSLRPECIPSVLSLLGWPTVALLRGTPFSHLQAPLLGFQVPLFIPHSNFLAFILIVKAPPTTWENLGVFTPLGLSGSLEFSSRVHIRNYWSAASIP